MIGRITTHCDDTKTINPIINEAFVASRGDIIMDYDDLYCLFTRRDALRCVNITMSAFVIGTASTVTQLKTCVVGIVRGKFFKYKKDTYRL